MRPSRWNAESKEHSSCWPNRQWQSNEGSSNPNDRLQSHQVHLSVLQYYTCMQYTVIQKIDTYTKWIWVFWNGRVWSTDYSCESATFFHRVTGWVTHAPSGYTCGSTSSRWTGPTLYLCSPLPPNPHSFPVQKNLGSDPQWFFVLETAQKSNFTVFDGH